jgi:hypothetical protein
LCARKLGSMFSSSELPVKYTWGRVTIGTWKWERVSNKNNNNNNNGQKWLYVLYSFFGEKYNSIYVHGNMKHCSHKYTHIFCINNNLSFLKKRKRGERKRERGLKFLNQKFKGTEYFIHIVRDTHERFDKRLCCPMWNRIRRYNERLRERERVENVYAEWKWDISLYTRESREKALVLLFLAFNIIL